VLQESSCLSSKLGEELCGFILELGPAPDELHPQQDLSIQLVVAASISLLLYIDFAGWPLS